MADKSRKSKLILAITTLVLMSLGCGSIQFGVVTPTAVDDIQPVTKNLEPEPDVIVTEEVESQSEADSASEQPSSVSVIAWLGHIASLPDSSQYDDFVILSPEGTGELGLTGVTSEIEAEIRTLRDAEGPNENIHLWGTLSCNVDDYNQCQLQVDKVQYGANYSEEDVVDWVGTIKGSTFNSSQSYVFELSGEFPMWYSINASQDEAFQAQIEALRDTGAIVKVSGKLLVGIPDVNGTRIEVVSLEVIEAGTIEQPPLVDVFDPTIEWPVFINDRYGYQISYPQDAAISLFGPEGFSMEDKPVDMSAEQYMDSLLKEYTNRLCVKIEYSLGWIYIAAPPNKEKFLTPCGPTGMGAGEMITKIETILIGDQLYQADGTEFKLQIADNAGNLITGETLDLHGEMFRVELEDGTVIRFGSTPRHDATYEDYLLKTKEILMQILTTYEPQP